MKKIKATVTNDFKNVRKIKRFKSEIFIAKYNDGEYYRMFIDREDDRRIALKFSEEEILKLAESIKNLKG